MYTSYSLICKQNINQKQYIFEMRLFQIGFQSGKVFNSKMKWFCSFCVFFI